MRRHAFIPYRTALRELGVTMIHEVTRLPHGTRAQVAGLIECLQSPPTKSGVSVYILVVEDEWGLPQTTSFRSVYERRGEVLHREGAFPARGPGRVHRRQRLRLRGERRTEPATLPYWK